MRLTNAERGHPCPPAGATRSDFAKIRIDSLFALRAQADRMSALHKLHLCRD
jgi:hypothetical protein